MQQDPSQHKGIVIEKINHFFQHHLICVASTLQLWAHTSGLLFHYEMFLFSLILWNKAQRMFFFVDLVLDLKVSSTGAFNPCVGSCGCSGICWPISRCPAALDTDGCWAERSHVHKGWWKWLQVVTPQKGAEQPVLLFHLKREISFTWTDFPFVYKMGKDFNSTETVMGFWRWPSHLPVTGASLWPSFPISVTNIITGAPGKPNVLVWGGVGSNKKKGTGCPELSTEGAAQPVAPRLLRQRQPSLFHSLSFSETEHLHLHSDAAESADVAGTTGVSKRTKAVGWGGWWKPQANRVLS